MAKIKYTCKNCQWETSIREEWGDLKPKRCMNKRCNTSFIKHPDALDIQVPNHSKPEEPKALKKLKKPEVTKSEE